MFTFYWKGLGGLYRIALIHHNVVIITKKKGIETAARQGQNKPSMHRGAILLTYNSYWS